MSGAIVLHTAETTADTQLPDGGAESVAGFIARRADAGSYHSVVDADSVVQLGRYEWEMFHEGTGGNRWSLGLSFACQAAHWPRLPEAWFTGALRNGAREAANMARWVEATVGIAVPAARITASQYRSAQPGFVGHGELDPGRRTDPGADFPWDEFLRYYAAEMASASAPVDPLPAEMLVSPPRQFHEVMADVDELYRAYRGARPNLAERRAWGKDLAEKLFATGEDTRPTLAYIEHALRTERS